MGRLLSGYVTKKTQQSDPQPYRLRVRLVSWFLFHYVTRIIQGSNRLNVLFNSLNVFDPRQTGRHRIHISLSLGSVFNSAEGSD